MDRRGSSSIHRISENAVAKFSHDPSPSPKVCSEILGYQLVASQTSIPVPQLFHVHSPCCFSMEYVSGQSLEDLWPTYSFFQRVNVVIRIRSYVHQLRKIRCPRSAIPGCLGTSTEGPKGVLSPMFCPRKHFGPSFASYSALAAWFNDRNQRALSSPDPTSSGHCVHVPIPLDAPFDDSEPLVFCHQDLQLRNFIVGDDGNLWLVDFKKCGFYPPWFEFVAMRMHAKFHGAVEDHDRLQKARNRWRANIPFMCGWYVEQDWWYQRMRTALSFE